MPKKRTGLAGLRLTPSRRYGTTRPSAPKVDKVSREPTYTGMIRGMKASRPEEMLANILDKYQKQYLFRYKIPAMSGYYGLRGEKEVDFVIIDGNLKPVQVADEEFVHASPEQKEKDRQSDIVVNEFFKEYGGVQVVWINAVTLSKEELAEMKVRELGLI